MSTTINAKDGAGDDAVAADESRSPLSDFDYSHLREATVITGKFAPINDVTWFLAGQGDQAASHRYVSINPMPFRIGRRSDLTLCLPFKTVSSLHAEILARGSAVFMRDLGSTNGTFVNGNALTSETELKEGDLVQFANITFRLVRHVTHNYGHTAVVDDVCDQALALTRFDELLSQRAVVPYFQPIVCLRDLALVGYEVLGRSRLIGLRSPKEMFLAAAQLNLEAELSRMLRVEGVKKGTTLPDEPPLFVNTHPLESREPKKLYTSLRELREFAPRQPITLEIHESAAVDLNSMAELRAVLNDLDMQLAYDDFGAGQARLVELVKVTPDYLKFDIGLVQDIHKASQQHQHMLGALVTMAHGLGIVALAEGVESKEDGEMCQQLGFELGQGYYYGKPASAQTFRNPPP